MDIKKNTVGRLPYGYMKDADGNRVEDKARQDVISKIVQLHYDGISQREIVNTLNDNETPPPNGVWHHSLIGRILKNARVK